MDTIDQTLATRGVSHGDWHQQSRVTQALKAVIQGEKTYAEMDASKREALDMIALKMGRILAGNSDFLDHWADICGYARLVETSLTRNAAYQAVSLALTQMQEPPAPKQKPQPILPVEQKTEASDAQS